MTLHPPILISLEEQDAKTKIPRRIDTETKLPRPSFFFFCIFHAFAHPASYFGVIFLPSFTVVTQVRGHQAGLPPPLPPPLRYTASFFSQKGYSPMLPCSTRIEIIALGSYYYTPHLLYTMLTPHACRGDPVPHEKKTAFTLFAWRSAAHCQQTTPFTTMVDIAKPTSASARCRYPVACHSREHTRYGGRSASFRFWCALRYKTSIPRRGTGAERS